MILSSCESLPVTSQRPAGELCSIHFKEQTITCSDNRSNQVRTLPLSAADNYLALSPDDWERRELYWEKAREERCEF